MDSHELKKLGLKATIPRIRVLELLERSQQRHLSAEDVYKALLDSGDDVGLATVYRVLTQFEEAGIVIRHHFDSGMSVFELNKGHHHDHIVCLRCGHIEEFSDDTIEERQKAIAENKGFQISTHSLYLFGTCHDPNTCPYYTEPEPFKKSQ